MNSFLVICLIAIISLSTATPQWHTAQQPQITVDNRKLSNANEVNTLDSSQQSISATGLAEISAKLREVADKLDILIINQMTITQQAQTRDPIPFKVSHPYFETNKDYISKISEAARKSEQIVAAKSIDEIPRFDEVSAKNIERPGSMRRKVSTTTPSVATVLERPYVEVPTQPMFRISDQVLGMSFDGSQDDSRRSANQGIISGQY